MPRCLGLLPVSAMGRPKGSKDTVKRAYAPRPKSLGVKREPRGPQPKQPRVAAGLEKFLEYYAQGISIMGAAGLAGITARTVYNERLNNPEFAAKMAGAAGAVELECIQKIRMAHHRWQSAAWLLSRKWPALYGERFPDPANMSKEEFERFAECIRDQVLKQTGSRTDGKQSSPED